MPPLTQSGEHIQEEEMMLRAGYFLILLEHPDIVEDPSLCLTPSSALFWRLEQQIIQEGLPEELRLSNLLPHIDEKHHARLTKIYELAKRKRRENTVNTTTLLETWEEAPEVVDPLTDKVMAKTAAPIRRKFEAAVAAIITPQKIETSEDPHEQNKPSQLELWRNKEKGTRERLYKLDKELIVAWRLYLEMLLEKPPRNDQSPSTESDWVLKLPYDSPIRHQIAAQNRKLRLIDATHQAISIAKAAHHLQHKGRMRKVGNVPYIYHPVTATYELYEDAIQYVIENNEAPPIDFVVISTACAFHDLLEDGEWDIDTIMEFLVTRADRYDSSLPIESGFEDNTREKIKERVLNLCGTEAAYKIRSILHLVTKNEKSPLTSEEKKVAAQRNIAGKKEVMRSTGISEREFNGFFSGKKTMADQPVSKTFKEFPQTHDNGKMTDFLIKLDAANNTKQKKAKEIAYLSLMIKIKDRTHNVATLEGRPYDKQVETLRDTTTRLIAWCVLDHDQDDYPLYNTLPRLIDVTIAAYERIQGNPEGSKYLDEHDIQYLANLKKWQSEVLIWENKIEVQEFLDDYRREHTNTEEALDLKTIKARKPFAKFLDLLGTAITRKKGGEIDT